MDLPEEHTRSTPLIHQRITMAAEAKEILVGSEESKSYGAAGADVAIVTGANTGIGKGAAARLLARGYYVIFACRSEARAREAMEDVRSDAGVEAGKRMEFMALDLGDFESVRAFAKAFLDSGRPLHVLLNNAGLASSFAGGKPVLTKGGHERTFGVNHLGPYLLTLLLLPALARTGTPGRKARVVMASSIMHYDGHLNFDNLQGIEPPVSGLADKAYKNSKLCNTLFANELQRRVDAAHLNVTANSLHPGFIPASNFLRNQPCCLSCFIKCCCGFGCRCCGVTQTVANGSHTEVFVCTDASLEGKGGLYINHDRKLKEASKEAQDPEVARKLWEASATMVGIDAGVVAGLSSSA